VLCFPVRFSGYLSWFDPSAGNVGSRVFDKGEAWDHTNESNPTTSAPYNGKVRWVIGHRGYWTGIHLTDGTSKVQVNIVHRYTDGAILVFNTGKDGTTSVNMTVRVYDPPSGLGYSVSTNGTRGSGYTDIAPGQYVLFYKGTAPSVDSTNGLFATSPLGSSKAYANELYVNAFTLDTINVPKIYLGIKAPSDVEVLSSGRLLRTYRNKYTPTIYGGSGLRSPMNTSSYIEFTEASEIMIYDGDPYASAGTWAGGYVPFKRWMGWGEDDNGNVKFIVISGYTVKHHSKWVRRANDLEAVIYDVERDEEYIVGIVKPIVNIYCYGEGGAVPNPFIYVTETTLVSSVKFSYIDANDTWNTKTSSATTTYEWYDNIYGYCNYYSNKIVCVEGLGVYTDDPNLAITNAKSAWGTCRGSAFTDTVGGRSIRVPAWGDKTWTAGKIYVMVVRAKEFPANTSDADLQTWMKSVQPKILSSSEVNGLLSALPATLWLFGQNTDTVSVTAPTSVNPGRTFNVSVSCPTRAGKTVWVALVDANGNVVASASGTLDSSGNATVSLTAPSTTGTYKVIVVVAGDRTLP